MKKRVLLFGLFILIHGLSGCLYLVHASEKLELNAGSLKSFNLESKVIKKGSDFFYQLYFHQQLTTIDHVIFQLSEGQLDDFLSLIDEAEKQIEKLKSSDIEEITVKVGSLTASGGTIEVSAVKSPKGIVVTKEPLDVIIRKKPQERKRAMEDIIIVKETMRFFIRDEYGLNSILRSGLTDREIQELKNHIEILKSRMNELKSISTRL